MKELILFFYIHQINVDISASILEKFKQLAASIYFSYFQVDKKYYLFIFAQNKQNININLFYRIFPIRKMIITREPTKCRPIRRRLRSLRGFILYALEIQKAGKDFQVLQTNLHSYFWDEVARIIRQNRKGLLNKFLFGKEKQPIQIEREQERLDNKSLQTNILELRKEMKELRERIEQVEWGMKQSPVKTNQSNVLTPT